MHWRGVNERAEGHPQAVPWTVIHAATVINKERKDDEAFTAHRRWKWRVLTRPLAEFGESVMRSPATSVGKNMFDVRLGGWRLACDQDGGRRVGHRRGESSCEGQRLQEEE